MSTQISRLQLCVEFHLYFLNWELQKISGKNFNRNTLHDCFLFKNCNYNNFIYTKNRLSDAL